MEIEWDDNPDLGESSESLDPTETGGSEPAEDFATLMSHHGPAKRPRTVAERERAREELLSSYDEEFSGMRGESGTLPGHRRPPPGHFPSLLRSDDTTTSHTSLPQPFLNEVWMRVLEADMKANLPEDSVMEVESMAMGLRPDEPLPIDPRIAEVNRDIAKLVQPHGAYIVPVGPMDTWPGEEGLNNEERVRRRHQVFLREKALLVSATRDETEELRRRQGLAGIPELARVLATCNPLWRRWWHRDFPRHATEYGTADWAIAHVRVPAYLHRPEGAPKLPPWILRLRPRQGLTDAEAGVEAQYSESGWRRFYAWTQFFERRCYRLIMDIAQARAENYQVVRPAFLPPGVHYAEPLRPDYWTMESADTRAAEPYGSAYAASVVYMQGADNNDDVDHEVNLDAIACLIPQTAAAFAEDAAVSAPLLAYIALLHAGDGADQVTLDGPCSAFAHLTLRARRANFVYNFLDAGSFVQLATDDDRTDKYQRIMLSYILWSVVTAQKREAHSPPLFFGDTVRAVSQRAAAGGLPVRTNLLDPIDQAALLGLYLPEENRWPFLEALPVVPMRGIHNTESRLYGHGGVHFLGRSLVI